MKWCLPLCILLCQFYGVTEVVTSCSQLFSPSPPPLSQLKVMPQVAQRSCFHIKATSKLGTRQLCIRDRRGGPRRHLYILLMHAIFQNRVYIFRVTRHHNFAILSLIIRSNFISLISHEHVFA